MVIINLVLFFLGEGQETIAWILFNFTILWQVTGDAFAAIFGLSEKVNELLLAATKGYFRFAQVVFDTFTIGIFVGHRFSLVDMFLSYDASPLLSRGFREIMK